MQNQTEIEEEEMVLEKAIEVAAKAHLGQLRKGTKVPYITHPFSVGMILARAGCRDEVIAAGILHDTVEDTSITLSHIREQFGDAVAEIVKGASEPDRSLSWEKRKKHTINFLETAPLDVRLVTCADKLHNIRTIALAYREVGDKVWDRFRRGKKEQEWYYRSLVEVLCDRPDTIEYEPLFNQLKEEVEVLFSVT